MVKMVLIPGLQCCAFFRWSMLPVPVAVRTCTGINFSNYDFSGAGAGRLLPYSRRHGILSVEANHSVTVKVLKLSI